MVEAAELMETLAGERDLLRETDAEIRERFLIAAGRVSRPDRRLRRALSRERRKSNRDERRDGVQALLNQTGVRKLRESPIFLTPRRIAAYGETPHGNGANGDAAGVKGLSQPLDRTDEPSRPIGRTEEPRSCYTCRADFSDVHHFYDQLCLPCGDFNFAKRTQIGDLTGRVALVTGSRVKIGYQAAILLLRSGCRVISTTRFPRDATRRYAAEEDFGEWGHRLEIHGIDLRHTPSVERFCAQMLRTHDRLDFIINNACQTVRRPPGFYEHLMELEQALDAELTPMERALLPVAANGRAEVSPAALSQIELLAEDAERGQHLFPRGQLDADLQQVDLRKVNSWRLKLAEVPTIELLEVHLVNAVAPFVLNARLKPLMTAVPTRDKHIVNVSAMEGQFYRTFKTDRHPHTNMAKASLNMLTRTSAIDYIEDGIHMNSVDTGWVTDEDPVEHAERKRAMHRFHPPLDVVDGAARIVDPIFTGLRTGRHVWGQFLKDYRETDW